jgi:pyrroline-5-carboxylate reductase
MIRIQVVGGGRMGEALAAGLIGSGWAGPGEICIVEVDDDRRKALVDQYEGIEVSDHPVAADGSVIAVKPNHALEAVRTVVDAQGGRILSIAAGVTIAALETAAGADAPVAVIRAMPNTPALIGQGASAIAAGTHAGDADLDWADSLLSSVGIVVRTDEAHLDTVTGLSGSGPAYVFLVAESLIEGAVLAGLPRETAEQLTTQTLLGAASLLASSDDGPEALRAAVTSPGGTTAAGLKALEDSGTRAALMDAVLAATRRSKELGS